MSEMKITSIKTHVVTCYSCGHWLGRMPVWASYSDKGDNCDRCGSTGVRTRDGRPLGPKSRTWAMWERDAQYYLGVFPEGDPARVDILEAITIR